MLQRSAAQRSACVFSCVHFACVISLVFHTCISSAALAHVFRALFLSSPQETMTAWVKKWSFRCPDCKTEKVIQRESIYPEDVLNYRLPLAPRCLNNANHEQGWKQLKITKFQNELFLQRNYGSTPPIDEEVTAVRLQAAAGLWHEYRINQFRGPLGKAKPQAKAKAGGPAGDGGKGKGKAIPMPDGPVHEKGQGKANPY